MRQRLEQIGTWLLIMCAVGSSAAFVHRTYFTEPAAPTRTVSYISDWRALLSSGRQIGSPTASVTLVEFGDYECPGCGYFAGILGDELRARRGALSVVYIHTPSPTHQFALPAARAAECAARQGHFVAYHDALFRHQDSLGVKSWHALALESGVPDLDAFGRCMQEETEVPMVSAGLAAARLIKLSATPTVIINGLRLSWVPSPEELHRLVDAAARGDTSVTAFLEAVQR